MILIIILQRRIDVSPRIDHVSNGYRCPCGVRTVCQYLGYAATKPKRKVLAEIQRCCDIESTGGATNTHRCGGGFRSTSGCKLRRTMAPHVEVSAKE